MSETIRILKSKRQSWEWGTSYSEKFTDSARLAYTRSAAILFPNVVRLSNAQVIEVYNHAIERAEIWEDLDSHGAPANAELRHSGGH